jgi:hypothetical protein
MMDRNLETFDWVMKELRGKKIDATWKAAFFANYPEAEKQLKDMLASGKGPSDLAEVAETELFRALNTPATADGSGTPMYVAVKDHLGDHFGLQKLLCVLGSGLELGSERNRKEGPISIFFHFVLGFGLGFQPGWSPTR